MNRFFYYAVAISFSMLLLLAFASITQADTITYEDAVPEDFVPISDALTFARFDSSTGILTSIDISVTSTISGFVNYANDFVDDPIDVSIQVTGSHQLGLPGGSNLTAIGNLASISETLGATGTPTSTGSLVFIDTLSDTVTISDETSFADFSGSGDVILPLSISAIWDASGGNPNVTVSLLSRASAEGRLRYNFVVPEVTLQKATNGFDADDAGGLDVPVVAPGDPVTWTYVVSNTGAITVPFAAITVTDSIDGVVPQFVPSSDDGDRQLAPDEAWIYQAIGVAPELRDPTQTGDLTIVPGCDEEGTSVYGARETYENIGTVTIPGFSTSDPSHYCNPAVPGIDIEKATNDADADDADGLDVPELAPGDDVVWTYVITNTGNVTFTAAQVTVADSIPGVTPVFDPGSDDGDSLLSPNESWNYQAAGTVADLLDPTDTDGLTIVPGCSQDGVSIYGQRATYENIGTVQVPGDEASDPSHYCNPAQPGIDIEKRTNDADADGSNDVDVPIVEIGQPVRWTYEVTNTGNVTFTLAQVSVTDDILAVAPVFDSVSDDGDGLLSPGESWLYAATGNAVDLSDTAQTGGMTIVQGCGLGSSLEANLRDTYENVGSVTVPGDNDSDPSHYCNPMAPTSIELVRFTAVSQNGGILIAWEVAAEIDTAGYHLYRSTGGRLDAVQINRSLIPADGETASMDAPLRYEFLDQMTANGVSYVYWLREVTTDGVLTEYGPVSAVIETSSMEYQIFLPTAVR